MTKVEKKEVIVQPRHLRIGVVGPMGSGKTTLMLGFREMWKDVLFIDEIFEDNPHLANQYKDPKSAAFGSQIWQLGTKIKQLKEIKADRFSLFIPLLEDKCYAEAYLSGDDWRTYLRLYNFSLELGMVPQPDAILKLVIEDDVLIQRVRKRDRDFERGVDPKFLINLNQIMTKNCEESGVPIIPVDAKYYDFRNPKKMEELIKTEGGIEDSILRKLRDKLRDPSAGLLRPPFAEGKEIL